MPAATSEEAILGGGCHILLLWQRLSLPGSAAGAILKRMMLALIVVLVGRNRSNLAIFIRPWPESTTELACEYIGVRLPPSTTLGLDAT